MGKKYSRAIHWFRRDLRLTDNTALRAATQDAEEIVPFYLLSDWKKNHLWTGPKRQQFLCDCLESLSKNIEHLGGKFIIRQGKTLAEIEKLAKESNADAIYFNQDVDPFGKEIEMGLARLCEKLGIACHSYQDAVLHGPEEILKGDGTPYRVYTPYSKPWLAAEKRKPGGKPKSLKTPRGLESAPLPSLKTWGLTFDGKEILPGGERAARERMTESLKNRVSSYEKFRDTPSVTGTSRLSQDLRWGTISVRELYDKAKECGSMQYLKELAWREFYFAILHHFPDILEWEFKSDWRGLPWDDPDEKFNAFKKGETGFPIIDAGVRELLATGFMHNRVRMIVAMFLTKDLHIDWRLGEQFFMQHLVDGEIASNNGGWQWSAGTGADAAPYFRIQNPWSQTKTHDPEGGYIRKWVPELANVPSKALYGPPETDRPIAPDYFMPILDHSKERNVTLARFKKHRADQS
ncbi:DNA photolyase family protein [bacterium]|nr:DNA photolyase family protein [bacterium]